MTSTSDRGPLAGFQILDFTRMVAGPYCTQQLGDLGADVIKIESPQGDDSRRPSPGIPGGRSPMHMSVNRNKRSIVLDLKSAAGKEIALELAARCDVLVENFATGVMARLGLSYDVIAAINPTIVYCSITGYGSADASDPPRPVYDGIIQAASGMMAMTGEADSPPQRTPYFIVDTASGMIATSGILAALLGRATTGRGQFVDVSLFDVAMSIVAPTAIRTAWTGVDPARSGNMAGSTAPSDAFSTADGTIFITCGNDRLFRRFASEALGSPEIGANEAYASGPLRLRNAATLKIEVEAIMARHPTAYWMARFAGAGVPASPVRTMSEVLAGEDAATAGSIEEIISAEGDVFRLVKSPHASSIARGAARMPPASLGEHTSVVMREMLHWDDRRIAEARASDAFGQAPHSQA